MQIQKRVFALLLCVAFVLTLFVSSTYVAVNAEHDCIGHGCDICEHIALIRDLLDSMSLLVVLAMLLFGAKLLRQRYFALDGIAMPVSRTLVGWKVRLND